MPAYLVDLKKMLKVIPNEKRGYFDAVIATVLCKRVIRNGNEDESGSEVWD